MFRRFAEQLHAPPTPGPAPVRTRAAVEQDDPVERRFIDLKVRLHQRLLEKLNLSVLDQVPQEEIRAGVGGIVRELLVEEWMNIRADRCQRPDGVVIDPYYVYQFPDWVTAVAITTQGKVILERQYRHALGQTDLELPGGCVDPTDASYPAAIERELLEETGYSAASWVYLGGFHNAFGYSDEKIELFLARDLKKEDAQQDAGEVIETFTAHWHEIADWIRDGTVTDVKTIIGIAWLEKWLDGKWRT